MSQCSQIPLAQLKYTEGLQFDLFICSSSFEKRSTAIADEIKEMSFMGAIICHYTDNYKEAETNFESLSRQLRRSKKVNFEKDDPISNLDNLLNAILEFRIELESKECKILLDITTFTHEMIMILVYLFKKHLTPPNFLLTIIYSSAQDYSIADKDIKDKWLSRGVGEIRTILGYPGELTPLKKTLLIVFVGYEEERVKSIIELFEPNMVLLGHASSEGAISQSLLEKNKLTYKELMNSLASSLTLEIGRFEFTCKVPDEVVSLLDKLVERYDGNYNIIIASLNNKISTLGCALAGLKYKQVQLCYPTAKQYNYLNYSKQGDNAFLIKI
jgi:hypothetical protein